MSSAGLNPQRNSEEYKRMQVVCSIIQETMNKLNGKKPGQVTIAESKGEKDIVEMGEPIIDATAFTNGVTIDDDKREAYRTIVVNGKQFQVKLKNYKEIKIKHDEWKKREGIEDKNKDQDAR